MTTWRRLAVGKLPTGKASPMTTQEMMASKAESMKTTFGNSVFLRTWVAEISLRDPATGRYTSVAASLDAKWYRDEYPGDLAKETLDAGLAEAAEYIRVGLASDARVNLWKTTKARGTEDSHQTGIVYEDDHHRVIGQRFDRLNGKILARTR
jgi:hypothetical protein